MGCHHCNSIDVGASKQFLVVVDQIELLGGSERRGHNGVDIATGDDLEAWAILRTTDDLLAPPAQADNPNSDHASHLEYGAQHARARSIAQRFHPAVFEGALRDTESQACSGVID